MPDIVCIFIKRQGVRYALLRNCGAWTLLNAQSTLVGQGEFKLTVTPGMKLHYETSTTLVSFAELDADVDSVNTPFFDHLFTLGDAVNGFGDAHLFAVPVESNVNRALDRQLLVAASKWTKQNLPNFKLTPSFLDLFIISVHSMHRFDTNDTRVDCSDVIGTLGLSGVTKLVVCQ
jgi:hypothetical protein